jgi:5'-nucleotidase
MQRRQFIRNTGFITAGIGLLPAIPLWALDGVDVTKLVILHTNDVHSRIEPFPMDGGKNQGKGGAARRAKIIEDIREREEHVLLLDAGDMFQGTPYFNFFGGEVEIKLMSEMKYDAGTIGNHDFDGGMENLAKQLKHATFPMLNANYNVKNTPLDGIIQDYKIFNKGHIKIGVFGVGLELKGLVPKALYGETQYNDPIATAQKIATRLRHDERCDFIICLSHLGYEYSEAEKKVSDVILASQTANIDLILGGHTHTFLDQPVKIKNKSGLTTTISQVGWGGMILGRLDILFERNKKDKCVTCKNHAV